MSDPKQPPPLRIVDDPPEPGVGSAAQPNGNGGTAGERGARFVFPNLLSIIIPVVVSVAILIIGVGSLISIFWGHVDTQLGREIGQLEQRTVERFGRIERQLDSTKQELRADLDRSNQELRADFNQLRSTLVNSLLLLNREVGELKGPTPQEE